MWHGIVWLNVGMCERDFNLILQENDPKIHIDFKIMVSCYGCVTYQTICAT